MIKIKLNRYDKILRNIGYKMFKTGAKLDRAKCYIISVPILWLSAKILNHITWRNGVPKGQRCDVSRDYIEY